jgi:hypothetical protein
MLKTINLSFSVLIIFSFLSYKSNSQTISNDSIKIELNEYAKDERFHKFQITLALFMAQGDTIKSMDFENLRPEKNIIIKKPGGYNYYAYGYLFFTGSTNKDNPGYVTVLVCNPFHKHPHMFVDYNQNFDFTDDPRFTLPYFDEDPIEFELANSSNNQARIKIQLTRNILFGKADFKNYMDEYYAYTYKGRKFVGIEYTYREQRFLARSGLVKLESDSFRIALYDANSNGKYNDADTDRVVFVNYNDTIFDATNPLSYMLISRKSSENYFEKNGNVFQLVFADVLGKSIIIKPSLTGTGLGRIKTGKKVPNIKLNFATGEKRKLRYFRRKEIYIYFAGPNTKNFDFDTMLLRQIAALDTNKLKVICVLYTRKSYDLSIFQDQAKPNYYVANGTRALSQKLGIRSLPQSLFLGKRRRVKQYGLKPNEFLRAYLAKQSSNH